MSNRIRVVSPSGETERRDEKEEKKGRLTPVRIDKITSPTSKTLPRKLSTQEEKKPKTQPKYGGFSGFGLAYGIPKSPPNTSPDISRTPTPSDCKSPEPQKPVVEVKEKVKEKVPDVKEKVPEVKEKVPEGKKKVPEVKEKVPEKMPEVKKIEEKKQNAGTDNWRERLKERQRQRELEKEKDEQEMLQRLKEREQRAKEREQREKEREREREERELQREKEKQERAKERENKEKEREIREREREQQLISSMKSTSSDELTRSITDDRTYVNNNTSSTSTSSTTKNRSVVKKPQEKKTKTQPKYGGFSGFGISYAPTSKSRTSSTSGSSPEPSRTPTPAEIKTSEPYKEISKSPEPMNEPIKTPEIPNEEPEISKNERNKINSEISEGKDKFTSSSSTSSSFLSSRGSNTSFSREKWGRQSDAAVSYFSSKLGNHNDIDNRKRRGDRNIHNKHEEREMEEETSPVISHNDERWSEESQREARKEKEKLREELEKQEKNFEKVQYRRRIGTLQRRMTGESALGVFYRRKSRLFDSEESSESKSPTPFQQRSSPSPVPIPSPSPQPSSPVPSLMSPVSNRDIITPPIPQTENSEPKVLSPHTPSQKIHTSKLQGGKIIREPTHSPVPEEHSPTPSLERVKESTAPHTSPNWKPPPEEDRVPLSPIEPRERIGTSSRVADQTKRMMALMNDEESVIEGHKVEVHRIQTKTEVCMYFVCTMYMYVLCMYCTCVCMYVYVCVYVCMYVCMIVCMYVCMYVCMCLCTYVYTCV